MSRAAGFPTADVDIRLMHDTKVIGLHRRLRDPQATMIHVAMYVAVVLESWSRGDRATLAESAPAWWLDDVAPIARELEAAGLLDADGRIPERSWSSWYGPAKSRRDTRRFEGMVSGLVSHGMPREAAIHEATRRLAEVSSGSPQGLVEVTPSEPQGKPDPSVLPADRPADRPSRPSVSDAPHDADGLGAAAPTADETCYRCKAPLVTIVGDLLERAETMVALIDGARREVHTDCDAARATTAGLNQPNAEAAAWA